MLLMGPATCPQRCDPPGPEAGTRLPGLPFQGCKGRAKVEDVPQRSLLHFPKRSFSPCKVPSQERGVLCFQEEQEDRSLCPAVVSHHVLLRLWLARNLLWLERGLGGGVAAGKRVPGGPEIFSAYHEPAGWVPHQGLSCSQGQVSCNI